MKIIIDTGNYELKEGDVLCFHKGKLTFVHKSVLFAEQDKVIANQRKEIADNLKATKELKEKNDKRINDLSKVIRQLEGVN